VRVLDLKTDRFTVIELKQGPLMKLEEIRCRMNIVLDSGRQEGTLQNAIQKLLNHWSSQLSYTKYMIDGLTDSEAQLAALKPVLIT
jgi:enoyl reductase-like protein